MSFMIKRYLLCFASLLSFSAAFSQAPSPEAFLGYPLGKHFTPHDKIVAYFKEVARTVPGQMKLEQYGTTYEGRPLLLAYIASPENIRRLEEIRLAVSEALTNAVVHAYRGSEVGRFEVTAAVASKHCWELGELNTLPIATPSHNP